MWEPKLKAGGGGAGAGGGLEAPPPKPKEKLLVGAAGCVEAGAKGLGFWTGAEALLPPPNVKGVGVVGGGGALENGLLTGADAAGAPNEKAPVLDEAGAPKLPAGLGLPFACGCAPNVNC